MISCIFILFVMLLFFGNPWENFLVILVVFGFNAAIHFINMFNPKGGLLSTAAMAIWTLGASVITSIVSWGLGFILYFTRIWELIITGCYNIFWGKSLPIGVLYSDDSISGFYIFMGVLYLIWVIKKVISFILLIRE